MKAVDAATTELRFPVSLSAGEVSAVLVRPATAKRLYVFAHGAGAGMRHAFMEDASRVLAAHGIATFRYQFPYVERSSKRIDPQPVLLATVRSAVNEARAAAPDLPLIAGGKSMGGRMTSLAAAERPLEGVEGLVFFGFPLHPAGAPSTSRAEHLARLGVPLLFLQGTRDSLADLDLLRPILDRLGPRATLHDIDGADHSFAVPKRTGRGRDDVLEEMASTIESWSGGR